MNPLAMALAGRQDGPNSQGLLDQVTVGADLLRPVTHSVAHIAGGKESLAVAMVAIKEDIAAALGRVGGEIVNFNFYFIIHSVSQLSGIDRVSADSGLLRAG